MFLGGTVCPQKRSGSMKRICSLALAASIVALTVPTVQAADVKTTKFYDCSPVKVGPIRYFVKCRASNFWNVSSAGPDLFDFYAEGPAASYFANKSQIADCTFLKKYEIAHCPGDKYLESFL